MATVRTAFGIMVLTALSFSSVGQEAAPEPEATPPAPGPETGRFHVVRGASWKSATVTDLRMASRNSNAESDEKIGFRIARNLE